MLFNVIIIFIPIFVSALSTLLLTIYVLTKAENRKKIASIPFAFYLVIWAVLSLIAGLAHKNFIGDAAFIVYLSFIIFSFYAFLIMTKPLLRRIIQLMAVLGIGAFFVAAAQHFLYHGAQSVSTFFNPNYYGFICEILLLVCFYAILRFKTCRMLYLASIVANIVGLWLSGCRSAWIAVLGGAIIILICQKKFRVLLGVLFTGAVGGVAVMIFPKLIPRLSSFGATESLRYKIWGIAFQGFLKHPIVGGGFMAYWWYSAGLGHRINQPHAHNILLNALDSYGTVGVLLLLIFIVPAVIACVKKLKTRPVCALVLGVIGAILIHGVTDDPILGMQTGIFVMTVIAMSGAKGEKEIFDSQDVKLT